MKLSPDDIRHAIEDAFKPAPDSPAEPLDLDRRIETMGVDSLRLSQIIMGLEAKLDVVMSDDVLNELGRSETLGDLYRTLVSNYAA